MSSTDRRDTLDAANAGDSLFDAIAKQIRNSEVDLRVAAPGTIIAYTPATQTAQVTLGYLPVCERDTPAGSVDIPEPPVVIPSARVLVPQGATWSDQYPAPVPGDTGLLIFCDRALDQWYLNTNPPGGPVDPIDGRTHDMADAVFLPGFAPDALRSVPALNPLARTIEAPVINLGAAATIQPVLRGLLNNTAVNTYATAIQTALSVYSLAMIAADGILNTAAQAYYAFPSPTTPMQRSTFASAYAAWLTAGAAATTALNTSIAAATVALASALTGALSTKVFVE